MPSNFNDNDQTKLYKADASDDQPTFKSRPYPQKQPQQPQYQNRRPAGYPYPQQNYQQGAYQQQQMRPQQPVRPQQQNMYAPPQYQQQYQQPQYRQPAGDYPRRNSQKKKNKGNSGIIILIIIVLLLIIAIVGIGIYMYIRNNDSGSSKKNSSETSSSAAVSDEEDTDAAEATDDEDEVIIIVPNVEGYDYRTAESNLLKSGLKCETEYAFSDSVSENIVISQSVQPGTEAAENTVVKIVVSQGKAQAEKVIVPNVTGLSYDEACRELEKAKLNPSASYIPHDKVAKDIVISQDTVPGTEVLAGTGIILSVSQGKDAQPATKAPSDDSKKYGYVDTAETDLNVRKAPSTDGERIGALPKGTKIEIVGSEGNWYKIVYDNGYGYVSKDYVKLID